MNQLNLTPNLAINQNDDQVVEMIERFRKIHYQPLPDHINRDDIDWCLVFLDFTKKTDPPEGDLYIVQHHGLDGDRGYSAFILKDMVKNRSDLSFITKFLGFVVETAKAKKQDYKFMQKCIDMIDGLATGVSMAQLMKTGILSTPAPSLN